MGYYIAGFDVVGVDIEPQPHYPFEFVQADALEYLSDHGDKFAARHASPPCQRYTGAQKIQGNEHPDLIDPVRKLLQQIDGPYVIENVMGAPLIDPVVLCGAMFPELSVYRHRQFETSFPLVAPPHPLHEARQTKMGRPPVDGEFMHVVGNFSGVDRARVAMDMPWATRDELAEAIPPAYTELIGHQLMDHLNQERVAA